MVKVGGEAPIFPPAWVLPQQPGFLQVIQRPLDSGTGESQFQCDGLDGRPAAALAVCPVLEVHIHTSGPVAQIGSIDISETIHFTHLRQGRKAVLRESGTACIP